ncbi:MULTISPECIES: aldo/keto reductase [unclassified Rathayibacter]|uniref:aldo/keto reductase n=1 Tax=unclassified Rathayibacter TaxID=2609250 RepID=UPI00104E7638|nr:MULTISPECIES: aldo/keto reductase [unclassified Rathayibacter]TCL79506.1 D-threo-aldose 1-dehydrogenase [Rathayibacter sp. PhB192]TCM25225.1 D-threo-aldose 1-dehydrogenase [Rathayibacter sp. PhB179]
MNNAATGTRPDSTPGAPDWLRPAGRTGLTVSAIGLGGAPLASMPEVLGYSVPADRAVDLVEAVLRSPIAVIDTSNGYNDGESERRIGTALDRVGRDQDTLVVTKVDASGRDYSGERVRRSVEESKQRLGMDRLPLVHLHDPEFFEFEELAAPGGAVEALVALREEGVIGAIGVAGGHAPTMQRYVDLGVFDALLVHNRLTLVDRSAEAVMHDASSRGMAVFNAAVLGGGLLAAPRSGIVSYAYRPASPAVLAAVAAMADVCDDYGVALGVVALQYALRESLVDCTLVGMSRPERVEWTLDALARPVPAEIWARIEALRPPSEHWLDARG